MANKTTEIDDLTSCPVCYEDFTEEGPQVPRILTCFHTLCEHCVEHLLQNSNYLECPECREKHDAPRGVKTFQQNKYIIAYVRKNRKSSPEVVISQERARCPDHGEDKTMFCKDIGCEKVICHLCLVKSHKFHDVVDLEEERNENYRGLVKDIEQVSKILMMNKKKFVVAQEGLDKRHKESLKMLKLRREQIIRKITEHMDKLEGTLCKEKTDQDTQIQNEMETIGMNIYMIRNLQDDVNETTALQDIKFKREIVKNICEEMQKRIYPNITRYLEYAHSDQLNPGTLEHLCGKTEQKEMPFTSYQALVSNTAIEQQNHGEEEINLQQNPEVPFHMRFPQKKRQQARYQIVNSPPTQTDPKSVVVDGNNITVTYRDVSHLRERWQIMNHNVTPDPQDLKYQVVKVSPGGSSHSLSRPLSRPPPPGSETGSETRPQNFGAKTANQPLR